MLHRCSDHNIYNFSHNITVAEFVVMLIAHGSVISSIHFSLSCLALNDLIRGRQADDLIDNLAEMWETLFRVLDDIKVR